MANGTGQRNGNLGLFEVATRTGMILFAGLGDVDNRVFGKEERTDQDEEHNDPNGFSTGHFSNYSSVFSESVATSLLKCSSEVLV